MASSSEPRVWLSREGKTDGPFSVEQIQSMKASGEFSKYAWFWEESAKAWKAIHPLPPPPVAPALFVEVPTPAPAAPSKALARALSAVCHDNRNIIGGTIASMAGQDSFFESVDHLNAFPPFRKGHLLWVNLLDEQSGQSENGRAEIVELKKTDKHWEYRLKWKELPKILSI